MSIVFLNGEFIESRDAKVSIFDTGFYYGEGIYEVVLLYKGKLIATDEHIGRFVDCLDKAHFKNAPKKEYIIKTIQELVGRNSDIETGIVFIQITRGVAENRYTKISELDNPTLVMYIIPYQMDFEKIKSTSINCKLIDDPRRYRRDIKMTSLMPMNLAKVEAELEGFDYVIYKDRISKAITEGQSSNLFMVDKNNVIRTHPLGFEILSGCTRLFTINALKNLGYDVREEKFYEEDLLQAKEIFVTGAIKLYRGVGSVNGIKIGNGGVGEIAKLCIDEYRRFLGS